MNEESFHVPDTLAGERLDKTITVMLPEISRSVAQKLIEDAAVTLNGRQVHKSVKINTGDLVCVHVPEPEILQAVPQDIPVEIVYEDADLLVVNKPKGMVVHPAAGNPDGTLVNALLYHCQGRLSSINGVIRPGIVHRIDKDTSGLLLVAKNDFAHQGLADQIKAHSFRREYRGVTVGHLPQDAGTVNAPIGRSASDRKKQAINGINAREAVTHYEVLERYAGFDYVKFTLETGRTHQIRVHCRSLGHPLAGDAVYGDPRHTFGLSGQCLHAALVGFVHPRTVRYMEFSAPLPAYFTEFLNKIKNRIN